MPRSLFWAVMPVASQGQAQGAAVWQLSNYRQYSMKFKIITAAFIAAMSLAGCGGDLVGFDDDKDGVRDDVAVQVQSLEYLSVGQRNSLMQMAAVYQKIMTTDFYDENHQILEGSLNLVRSDFEMASNCMLHQFATNGPLLKTEMRRLRRSAANNDPRIDKVKEFEKLCQIVHYQETHFEGDEDTCFWGK